jgi:hypothetical protein
MRYRGMVRLDERILPAIAQTISPVHGDLEYLIRSQSAARAVKALMETTHSLT